MVNDEGRNAPRLLTGPLALDTVQSLPSKFDERAVEDCLTKHIDAFRGANSLFEEFMVALRSRYHTRWEIEILQQIESKLKARVSVMEASVSYNATRGTLRERTETQIFNTKAAHEKARQEYLKVQTDAPGAERLAELEAENKVLNAQHENEQLKRKIADVREKKAEPNRPPPSSEERNQQQIRERMEKLRQVEQIEKAAAPHLERLKQTYGEESEIYLKAKRQVEGDILRVVEGK